VQIALAVFFALSSSDRAEADEDLAELRHQLEELRQEYEGRLQALEARLEAAEATARQAKSRAVKAERAVAETAPVPAAPAPSRAGRAFNPAISLILQGRYAAFPGDEGQRELPGLLIGEETGIGPDGFSVGESELDLSANIDDKLYGFFDVAFDQVDGESEVEIEEAYIQTLALPMGFNLKGGMFLSAIGYQNSLHSHAWDFVDAPLAYEGFLGPHFLDPGIQLTWLAPTDLFLELGGEMFRGDSFPAAGAAHDGRGAASVFAKVGGDVGVSNSWKAGVGYLMADPRDRETHQNDGSVLSFTGDSDLLVTDFLWKWASDGNFRDRYFILQTEYLYRHEEGELVLLDLPEVIPGRYRGHQHGFYTQGVFQFIPRWRLGLRYGRLFSDNRVSGGLSPTLVGEDDASPWRVSAMLDFSNSEFSRFRLQYNREGGRGFDDRDFVFLQYIGSLGSHGAHRY
jgi:hypothetical protein